MLEQPRFSSIDVRTTRLAVIDDRTTRLAVLMLEQHV